MTTGSRVPERCSARGAAVRLLTQRDDLGHPRDTQRGVALPAEHPLCVRADRQTAKQARIGRNSPGIFTFNFFTVVRNNPGITIGDVQKLLTPELSKFGQQVEMYPTRQEMLYRPVFPLMQKN